MAAAKKKPSSLADNPPVELYGPEDGGWYSTRVHDWIGLCPDLRDPDVRGYLVLRSLVIEKYKNPVRKLTLLDLCELIPSPTKGQPSSLTRVRGILEALSAVGLVSTPEGGPVKTSSRASAAGKPIRIRVNDLPPAGYAGWRNTEDKLSHILQQRAAEAGRKSDPAGLKSDPRGRESDPDAAADLPEAELPLVSSVGTPTGGDALSARSAGDGRRPSDGSSASAREGGSAASSKDHPTPDNDEPQARAKTSSKAKHTREQLDTARKVCAFFPAELRIRLVPVLTQAILDALDGDVPGSGRTVEQLGARIQQRWNHHGYASAFYAGELTKPIGAAVEMVRPLKASDRYGCGNPRCEVGVDVDTGVDCHVCPERLAARSAARRDGDDQFPSPRPGSSGPVWWECESPMCRKPTNGERSANGLCPDCDAQLERAAALLMAGSPTAEPAPPKAPEDPADGQEDAEVDEETIRLRAAHARRYGTPEQVEAYCTNAPF
jgi:hypothetical protein